MNKYYNNKDKHTDNDFEIDEEDFLNSSMRDMDSRTNSKGKKKIKKDYDEGIQFVDLASLDRDSLFKSSVRTPENSEYMSTVFRGFVFIFMLLISVFAIFLIFKTPYYSYYNQKEPIVLDENKKIMYSDPFGSPKAQTQEELKQEIIEPEEDNNVKLPTAIVSKPKTSDKDEMLRREFENSKSNKNKKDTELTKLLKNSDAVITKGKKEEDIANNMPQDVPVEELNEEIRPKKNSSYKYPAMKDKKMLTENSKVLSSDSASIENKDKKDKVNKSEPVKKAKEENKVVKELPLNKPDNLASQNVWLVNIYSTKNKNDIHERLLRLKNKYKKALMGTTFYLVDLKTEKGETYRISVTENQSGIAYPSFATNLEAKSFCTALKSKGLDCFVSSVNKSALPRYIVR